LWGWPLVNILFGFSGQALQDCGEAFSNLAEIKEALDSTVKQNFLDPLDQLRNRDIKEIMVLTFVNLNMDRHVLLTFLHVFLMALVGRI